MVNKSNVLLGVTLLCIALVIVPVNDALAKYLSSDLKILEIIWARFFGHFILLVPLAYYLKGRRGFFNSSTKHQLTRGLFIFLGTAFFYVSITKIPFRTKESFLFPYPEVLDQILGLQELQIIQLR